MQEELLTELSPSELERAELEFNRFFTKMVLGNEPRLANLPEESGATVYANGQAGSYILGAVGGVAGFFLGGPGGAAIGLSLGMTLGSAFFGGEKKKQKPRQNAPTYSFSSGGSEGLAQMGESIPLVYCDSTKNPNGGVRWTGKLVSSRVKHINDFGELTQVYCLGYGEIQSIDSARMLIDGQPTDRFYPDEISTTFRSGTPTYLNQSGQTSLPSELNFFGQSVTPNTFTGIGVSLRADSKSSSNQAYNSSLGTWIVSNCYVQSSTSSGTLLVKNGGSNGSPDAYAYSSIVSGSGGASLAWKITDSGTKQGGFGSQGSSNTVYGIKSNSDGTLAVIVNGSTYTTTSGGVPLTWTINDVLRVELTYVSGVKVVVFYKNGVVMRSFNSDWANHSANISIWGSNQNFFVTENNGIFSPVGSYGVGASSIYSPSNQMDLVVYEDEADSILNWSRFTPSEDYIHNGQKFRVLSKEASTRTIRITPIISVTEGDAISAVWTAYYQTAKKCTQIIVNFDGLLYSRPKPENEDLSSRKGGKGK